MKNQFITLLLIFLLALSIRFGLIIGIADTFPAAVRLFTSVLIIVIGAFVVLKRAADIIEETTEVLSERTKIASGVLQSIGTAFPDMALGVVAAIVSLQLRSTDYRAAINYAIIAAATTFGSNIYNIGHAAWCILRQNQANRRGHSLLMFPGLVHSGRVKPISEHLVKPKAHEINVAEDALITLTFLTALVASCMVLFGQVSDNLYQLIRPVGAVIILLCGLTLYLFRQNQRSDAATKEVVKEESYYRRQSTLFILLNLVLAGIAILLSAESMIHAIEVASTLTHLPVVVAGVLSGIIGCLGEMIVVHNFTIHPNGRIGDAIMGVAMDNIVTTLGAGIVAVMGGIFLGGNALIIIFVFILTLNAILLWQISRLKDDLAR